MKCKILIFLIAFNIIKSQIVINEFQPAPLADDEEWIELYNNSDSIVVLNNLSIWDLTSKKDIGKVLFQPRSLVVITSDTLKLKNKYKIDKANLIQKPIPTQNNTYDAIFIKNDIGEFLDSTYYDLNLGEKGKSFERFNPDSLGFYKNNWKVTKDINGGTPCKTNSTSIIDFDLALYKLDISKDSLSFVIMNEGKKDIANTKFLVFFDSNMDSIFQEKESLFSLNIDYIKSKDSAKISFSKKNIKDKINKSGFFNFKYMINSDLDLREYNNYLIEKDFISYSFAAIQINEIMYESSQNNSDFIELWNNTLDTINLNYWQFYNKSDLNTKKTNKINGDYLIAPDSLFLIAYDTTIFNKFPNLRTSKSIYFSKSLILNSTNQELFSFSDPNNFVIDSALFDKTWHQAFIIDTKDISLEKVKNNSNSNLKTNWSSSIDALGATPLLHNSITSILKDTLDFYAEPNPFSPYSDGLKSHTKIYYKLPFKSANIILKLFDLNGILLRDLRSGENSEQQGEIVFEGNNNNGSLLQVGAYILFLEATDKDSGEVYSKKILIAIGK
ncbi:MAG: hypothetical protein NTW25_13520 [Candidatus Kapabacteria bacterium]|nr:hypothetical protein [Candidatus Kapabacteria bacterium]